jgi:hypothetical protein
VPVVVQIVDDLQRQFQRDQAAGARLGDQHREDVVRVESVPLVQHVQQGIAFQQRLLVVLAPLAALLVELVGVLVVVGVRFAGALLLLPLAGLFVLDQDLAVLDLDDDLADLILRQVLLGLLGVVGLLVGVR